MIRAAATLSFLVLAGLAVLAARELYVVWQAPLPQADLVPNPAAQPDPATRAAVPPEPPRRWPALFGEAVVPEPQPPEPPTPEPAPEPPGTPVPPVETLGYQIKGIMGDGDNRWALVSHPTGEKIMRVGDPLGNDYTIVLIDPDGIWVASEPGGKPSLLGFVK